MTTPRSEVALLAGAAGAIYLFHELLYKDGFLRRWLEDWMDPWIPVGTISELHLSPVKSMRAHLVPTAHCSAWGLQVGEMIDRHLIVIENDTGKFMAAKYQPKLVRILPTIENGVLTLESVDNVLDPIHVSISDAVAQNKQRKTELYTKGQQISGLDMGAEIGDWISKIVYDEPGKCRLLYHIVGKHTNEREMQVDTTWCPGSEGRAEPDKPIFGDENTYMLMSEGSLADLNSRFSFDGCEPYSARQFRPTILITGCVPYEEDKWRRVKIGRECEFLNVKPCTRCVLVLVDPEKGTKAENNEPLKTLRAYRSAPAKDRAQYGYSPFFGIHLGVDRTGNVNVGDTVYAKYKKNYDESYFDECRRETKA
uniref:MOSC domain-containing protein n=1 Tax=Plectus sambesii TaxID=2011161 RepID=A0A914VQQ5_9BILA